MQKLNRTEIWLDNVYYPCHDRLRSAGYSEEGATKALSIAMDFSFDLDFYTDELCKEVVDYNKLISKDCE